MEEIAQRKRHWLLTEGLARKMSWTIIFGTIVWMLFCCLAAFVSTLWRQADAQKKEIS